MDKDVKLRTFGSELMMLYGRINLSQSEFASAVGVSSVALRKWESGQSCPKAESVKRVIEILTHKGAFKQGAEQTEALHLWELAMRRGLKAPFDEVWFVGIKSSGVVRAEPSESARVEPSGAAGIGSSGAARAEPDTSVGANRGQLCLVPGADPVRGSDPLPHVVPYADLNPASPRGLTLAPTRTRGWRKGQLVMLIVLVILLIIGLVCTLFVYARGHAIDQTYPGYLSGHGTLAFFDPLSQSDGLQWSGSGTHGPGVSCQFTGSTYHVTTQPGGEIVPCSPEGIFSNFALEVQLTITRGDCGGLFFRSDGAGHVYFFYFCQDSEYGVWKSVQHAPVKVLSSGWSSAIHAGLGQQNKMAVVANGNSMSFYVNEQQINHIQDSTYTLGQIALLAFAKYNHVTDVAYSNARLWTL